MIFAKQVGRKITHDEVPYLEIVDGMLHIMGRRYVVLEPKMLYGVHNECLRFIDARGQIESVYATAVTVTEL